MTDADRNDGKRQGASGLDAAIDRALRRTTAVDADPAFRARVQSRLAEPAPRLVTWPRLALAAAGAVAVLMAVLVMRPAPDVGSERVATVRTEPAAPAPARPLAPPAVVPPDPAGTGTGAHDTASPRQAAARRAPAPAPAEALEGPAAAAVAPLPAVEIPPLAAIEPIAVAPLQTRAIVAQEIVVEPLAPIAAVYIEPLAPLD